ncbi:MAG: DUF5684 domain-containing protein [Crocinitomicaceae bacterium]
MKNHLLPFVKWIAGYLVVRSILYYILPDSLWGFYFFIHWVLLLTAIIGPLVEINKKAGKIKFGNALGAGALGFLIIPVYTIVMTLVRSSEEFYLDGWMLQVYLTEYLIHFAILLYLLLIIGMIYTFRKAGKPGWAVFIPIYNIIVMLEIAKKPTWWAIMILLVPIANIIFAIMTLNGISKNFGKSEGFTVGLVFLGPIFWCILGYGDAKYIGESDVSESEMVLDA